MTEVDRYPPREAFATRPPADMSTGQGDEATALDRPRFVVQADLGVPHTRERLVADLDGSARPLPASAEQAEPASTTTTQHVLLVLVAALGATLGAAFGAWLALGAA